MKISKNRNENKTLINVENMNPLEKPAATNLNYFNGCKSKWKFQSELLPKPVVSDQRLTHIDIAIELATYLWRC